MSNLTYPTELTAYLLGDPYNDFLTEGGKAYPFIEAVANEVQSPVSGPITIKRSESINVDAKAKANAKTILLPQVMSWTPIPPLTSPSLANFMITWRA